MENRFSGRRPICGLTSISLLLVCALLLLEATSAAAPARAQQLARQEFKKGNTAFAKDKFSQALKHYQKAYELLPLPGFLFNIAQCHRNLGDYARAITHYRLYLKKKPDAGNRPAVEQLLQELEQQVAADKPPHQPPPANPGAQPTPAAKIPTYSPQVEQRAQLQLQPQPPPDHPPAPSAPFYKRWWFWTSIAVVAAGGAAAGVYFGTRPGQSTLPDSPYPALDFSL